MSRKLKQSTARNIVVVMVDETDHITGLEGLTLAIEASKNGGALASISPTVTERSDGGYQIALTASHTDTLGDLWLHITATGADPVDLILEVEAVAPTVSLGAGSVSYSTLAADATTALGIVRRNTAQAGGATSITLDASANATDDFYNGMSVLIVDGTGALQERTIIDYVGSSKVTTVDAAWTTTPDNTSVFLIRAGAPALNGIARADGLYTVEGSYTRDQLIRLLVGIIAGTVADFETETQAYRSLDGSKTRYTVTTDESGRVSIIIGDLS